MSDNIEKIHDLQVKKKARFAENPIEVIKERTLVPIRANEKINLYFHQLIGGTSSISKAFHPEYTHQLFNDELIDCLYEDESKDFVIDIHVDTATLGHVIRITENITQNIPATEQIKTCLSKGIPEDSKFVFSSQSLIEMPKEECISPIGKTIHNFHRGDDQYILTLATHEDPNATQMISRLEKVAMWFIETADAVDFQDSKWEVVFLYQQHVPTIPTTTTHYSLLGYMTLYTFNNPFQGSKLRICQALIFPMNQGQGLGQELLHSIYQLAATRESIVEITVEDPSPAFQQLRDLVDIDWLIEHCDDDGHCSSICNPNQPTIARITKMIAQYSTLVKEELMSTLKLIAAQVLFLLEVLQYAHIFLTIYTETQTHANVIDNKPWIITTKDDLLEFHDEIIEGDDTKEYRAFRLFVKRNCVKLDNELKDLPKSQMQEELSNLFDQKVSRYLQVLYHLYRKGLLLL